MIRVLFLGLLFGCLGLACSKASDHKLPDVAVEVYRDLKYGTLERNRLDVFRPVADSLKSLPIVLFVHGGGWCQFDKSVWWKEDQISLFARNHFVSVAIDYSLSPLPFQLDNPSRVHHPAHIRDLAKAVRWVTDSISKYGGDPERIYLMGHSAGAQMVCLLATNEKYLKEVNLGLSSIKGVVSLDGGAYLTLESNLLLPPDNNISDVYYKTLKECYLNAFTDDPAVQRDASPYHHIGPGKQIPPFLLFYEEEAYRKRPNERLSARLEECGYRVKCFNAKDLPHNDFMYSLGSLTDRYRISDIVLEFLSR